MRYLVKSSRSREFETEGLRRCRELTARLVLDRTDLKMSPISLGSASTPSRALLFLSPFVIAEMIVNLHEAIYFHLSLGSSRFGTANKYLREKTQSPCRNRGFTRIRASDSETRLYLSWCEPNVSSCPSMITSHGSQPPKKLLF